MTRRIACPSTSLPLHDTAATRAIERAAHARVEPHGLMRRAGEAVARVALAVAPHARAVWIAAGGGNNGGDGFEAAIHLKRAGRQVHVTLCGADKPWPEDAADALARAQAAGVRIDREGPPALSPQDLAIDALLGLGSTGEPREPLARWIARLTDLPCPVLAIDLPSGLDADTGRAAKACVRADHTVSLLTIKPGLFTAAGRDQAGTVWLDGLGADIDHPPTAWLTGSDLAASPKRSHGQNKGSFGDVAVVAGAHGMAGALLMAATAAHASGAGRVYASPLDPDLPLFDPVRPELMFRREWWASDPAVIAKATLVCGCGGGDAVRTVLPGLLGSAQRLVLDADALNHIGADPSLQVQLQHRASRGQWTVLTPHPLEAARLLGTTVGDVQADRLAAVRALVERYDCVALIKGSGTVIDAPGLTPFINPTGNAALATAGTGDVLAGWLGGRWAQAASHGKDDLRTAFDAACAAVHIHGHAADLAGASLLRAADLIERMAQVDGVQAA